MSHLPPHPEADPSAALARATRELNDLIAVQSYERGRPHASHRPIELYMQVASACNLDCYMCSEHNRPPEWRRGRGATSLPPELYAKVESELFPYARRLTIGVGGEPMISPHFLDYVERAHAAGLDVHVMSNGTRIRDERAAETLARCTKSLEISVDAARPETYERIRLGSRWKSLNANLERLVGAIARQPEGQRPHLTLCFVLMRSNVEEFGEFVEFGARIGADRVAGWHVIPVTEEGREESLQVERERSNQLLERARQRGIELGIDVDVPAPFDLEDAPQDLTSVDLAATVPEQVSAALSAGPAPVPDAPPAARVEPPPAAEELEYEVLDHPAPEPSEPAPAATPAETDREHGMRRESTRHRAGAGRIHCSSPTTSVFLFYDGRVLPCCHPHAHAQLPMGNLWDQSFSEIWNGELYRHLRAGLHEGDVPPLCQTCSIVHSPPPRLENPEELLAAGNDLASWYAGRPAPGAPGEAPGWADPALLERFAELESRLAQSGVHSDVVEAENRALKGHLANLERMLDRTGARFVWRAGGALKDLVRGRPRGGSAGESEAEG